jgi:hypothetical protein
MKSGSGTKRRIAATQQLGRFRCEADIDERGEGTPCSCVADGVMLAVYASPGQGTPQIAPEKSAPGTFAVVVIKPRKGGDGFKYTVPMSFMPKLGQINSTIQDPLGRYNAVMALPDLFTVEPVK